MHQLTRALVPLLALLVLAAACQGAPAPSPGGGSAAAPGQAGGGAATASGGSAGNIGGSSAPRRGGTFIMVLSGDPSYVNPALTSGNTEQAASCIPFQGLVSVDSDYNPQPL